MMAITDPSLAGPSRSPVHFDAGRFDALILAHGSLAHLRRAQRCACWDARAGHADPSCKLCFPFGWIWDAPEDVTIVGPGRRSMRQYLPEGERDEGDCTFTFPTGVTPPRYSRITLPLSIVEVDDILTKGEEDIIRYSEVVSVESAFYTKRNPPTGTPFVTERHDLALSGSTPDLTFSGRQATWLNSAIPDGTRYSVRFKALQEYVVFGVQDRNENGKGLPYRFICKQLEFYIHPKAGSVSY